MSRDNHKDDESRASAAERAQAEGFGRLVDDLLAGVPPPPAMDPDQRALVETATVVVASNRIALLDESRVGRLVDEALEAAVIGGSDPSDAPVPEPAIAEISHGTHSVTDVKVRRRRGDRYARALPWVVASVAAAAAIVAYIASAGDRHTSPTEASRPPAIQLTVHNTSRPADPLIGRIARADADHARERVDILFADRMSGYRDLTLRRGLVEDKQ